MTEKGKRLVSRIALTQKIRDALYEFLSQQPEPILPYGLFVGPNFEAIEDREVVEFYKAGDKRDAENKAFSRKPNEWFCGLDYKDKSRIERYLERKNWKRTNHGWR